MATTKEVLVKARELISKGWTQGALMRAKDMTVQHVGARGYDDMIGGRVDGACYCISGAIFTACGGHGQKSDMARNALSELLPSEVYRCIPLWNDDPQRKHDEVIALFDRAIDACEES